MAPRGGTESGPAWPVRPRTGHCALPGFLVALRVDGVHRNWPPVTGIARVNPAGNPWDVLDDVRGQQVVEQFTPRRVGLEKVTTAVLPPSTDCTR